MELNNDYKIKFTHHVTKILNISDSSLRRWCRELQSQGYHFEMTDDLVRVFRQKDIEALLYLKDLIKLEKRKLDDGAKEVAQLYSQLPPVHEQSKPAAPFQTESSALALKEQLLSEIEGLKQKQNSLEHHIQELQTAVQQAAKKKENEQKPLLDNRDKELMLALREIQQAKNAAAAARQKKWWHLWV